VKLGKGKRFALVAGVACLAVVVAAAVVLRRPITEEWYIHRLASEDEATVLEAARSLARLGSTRAIPALIQRRCSMKIEWEGSGWLGPVRGPSPLAEAIDQCLVEIVTRPGADVSSSLSEILLHGSADERFYAQKLIQKHALHPIALEDGGSEDPR
jgi:C4-dicarboxylate-specific signal transduction histidine kinase